MDFQSAMETFAEAWVAANTKQEPSSFSHQSEPLELTTRSERSERSEQDSPRPAPSPPPPPLVRDIEESQSQGRSLPVHCVVETVWSLAGLDNNPPSVEMDSYVIVPVSTTIQDLLSVALHRLGYTKENIAASKGWVVIRNWRPVALDNIAETPIMTVGEILGELTSLATLRIQVFRARPNSLSDMKEKLLKLLLLQHHAVLAASGCPLDEMVGGQQPTPKTRMRTSFDPELELPKLQQWFLENPHPSRQQIQQFVRELNSLESRRGRKPLDVNNVVYWFKNARAAQKRAEIRNLPPALQYKLMLNGYHSNSQSPSEGAAAKSPGSLNQDSAETLEPLLSPQVSPQPPDKSPLPPHENHHEGSGGEEGGEQQGQDSISDSANNNNPGGVKDESGDEEEEDEEEEDYKVVVKGEGSGGERRAFPVVPNSMFSHSIMYMSHYFPGGLPPALADERRKRNRTFIDPVSEVPRLEQWFSLNTHPSHALILKYTDDLNQMPYRQKFPPLEPKNVQFWFKNRRAKCKRLKMSLFDPSTNAYLQPSYPHHIPNSLSGEPYQAH